MTDPVDPDQADAALHIDVANFFNATIVRSNRFALYIPNKTKFGDIIADQTKWVSEALMIFSQSNGGATAMPPIRGSWLNPELNELVDEEPVIVYTFMDPEN